MIGNRAIEKGVLWRQFRKFCVCLDGHVTMKFPLHAFWTQEAMLVFLFLFLFVYMLPALHLIYPASYSMYVCMYIVRVLIRFKSEAVKDV